MGAWSALSLLTGWQYHIFDQSVHFRTSLTDMLLLAEGRGMAFALLTPPIFYIVRRSTSGAREGWRYVLVWLVGAVPFMLLWACLRWMILPSWSPTLQRFVSRANSSPLSLIHAEFADIVTIYCATVLAAHGYDYLERVRKQELERSEYQQALAASELQALKMQLHPHFLFNTLHGISTLIDSDSKSAKAMIVKLSHLLRTALKQGASEMIQLQEELKFIAEYLDLETMRFGSRLHVTWDIAPVTEHLLIPQLILQPLVENAIQHGVGSSRAKSWIEVTSQCTNDGLVVRISNSTGGQRAEGTGVGLRNTMARLKYLYTGEATCSFVIGDDHTATVILTLPVLGSSSRLTDTALGRQGA
jgi:two-component system, LytTR family, sensor kinase